ncbi:MAG: hypothetical protein IPP17_16715 [Bacteroidetes bacterium]|nr:hypothetical protein [Bacteroidota bacterium]
MKKLILFIAYLAISQISAGQIVSGSFVHDNIIRNFDLHLPTGWTSNDSLPLLLDFHYLGADGRDEDTLTQFNPIADAEGFIVCHPWGFLRLNGQNRGWNQGC